jgi:hypothetical protein
VSGLQLTLRPVGGAEAEVVDGEPIAAAVADVEPAVLSPLPPPFPSPLVERNFLGKAQRTVRVYLSMVRAVA